MSQLNSFPTDHSKVANKLVFNFHSDSSHGWLAVKNELVRELGLAGKISECSYIKGKTSYLEEDRDASLFVKAFETKFGIKPVIKSLNSRDRSLIRSFPRFKMEF
jgi:hypothetical protein